MSIIFPDDCSGLGFITVNSETNCEESSCCDDYCRCRRITGVTVSLETKAELFSMVNQHFAGDDLGKVLFFWFIKLNKELLSENHWVANSCGGYYGDELESVHFEGSSFYKKVEAFEELTTNEKIHYLLTEEYGNVLPEVLQYSDWQLKPIFVDDLEKSSNERLDNQTWAEYQKICAISPYAGDKYDKSYENYQNRLIMLAPLCLPKKNGKYQLIDGRHRADVLTAKQGKDFIPIWMWVLCPKENK